MKIYLFNPETGCYLGEDFADEGMVPVPPDATTVAPPRTVPGQVPVFDFLKKEWKLEVRSALFSVPPAAAASA